MFMVFALAQLLSMIFARMYEWSFVIEGLIALVPVFLFMPLGNRLGRQLGPKGFDMIFLAALAMSALALAYSGWTAVSQG